MAGLKGAIAVIQEFGCLAVIHTEAHELLARIVAAPANGLSGVVR